MEEWKEYTIEDVLELLIDYRGKTPKKSETGIPTLSAKSVKMNHIDYSQCYYISKEEYDRFMIRGFPKKGDILLTTEAPLGMVARLDRDDIALGQRLITLRGKKDVLDNGYLLYYFQSPAGQYNLKSRETGTTVTGIKQSEFRKLRIPIPPLPTQQKIAAILSSLDDKIELNNKINTNLEQQAQALFKNWFVDFEPFGGKIPEGWKVGKLSDIAKYSSEKIEISKLTPETYYSTENMLPSKGGIETATSLPSISQTTRCLPGETIISNIRPYFKKIFYCTEEVAGCSTDVLCFKTKYKDYSEYLYQVLYSDIFFDYMVLGSKGTKMPRGDKQQIMNYPITIPNELYLRKFKTFAKPILSQIDLNRKENKRLSEIRDTLLPKLTNSKSYYYL